MSPRTPNPRGSTPPKTAKRRSILVFTEGKKTEPIYLLHWHRLYRDRVIMVVDEFHGGPLQLVEAACDRRAQDLREMKRGRGEPYDEYWCVFDVDEHPGLAKAFELAAKNEISVAVSNPCVELWFLIHFQDQWASLDRHKAQDIAAALLNCGKTPTVKALQQLVDRYEEAAARAKALDKKHKGDGSLARSNPSTDLWRVIQVIRAPSK